MSGSERCGALRWRRRRRRRGAAGAWGAAALVAAAAALASASAAAPSPPQPSAPAPSSTDLRSSTSNNGGNVVNWAVNSVSLASAKSGGPVAPPQFGATADNIARRLAQGGNADGSLVHFATHGVVNIRIDVGDASPEVVDAMVGGRDVNGGRGGAVDSGALPMDETPGDDSDNPTPGTPAAAAAARLAALGQYAASAVTLPLGPGSSPPQVFIGREPMPPAQLSWRLSDGRASTPDPAAWPAAPSYGGDWPMLRPQRSPAPAPPAEMPAAKVVVLGGERRRRRSVRLLRRLLAAEDEELQQPKGGNNNDNNKAAAAQQPPKNKAAPPAPDDVPLYVSYYALSPMQAELVAGYLNRLCPLNTRADGSSADATVGGGRAPPPTLGTACVAALSRAAAVLRPSQEEASKAPNGSAIARAYEWGAQPLAYLREPASVATYLTTAVPMTAQQVDEGAADKTASFFGDGSKLQREVAPPGVDVSPLPPQHFYGSYLPRGLKAASFSATRSPLDPWKIALIVLASLAVLAILVGAGLLVRRAVRARKAAAAGGEMEEEQKRQAGANGSFSGRGGGGKGNAGGRSAGAGGGRRKRRASLYGVDKSSGKRGSTTSSGAAGPSSSSGAAGPSSASVVEGGPPRASGPSFGIVGAVFHGLRSSFTGGRGGRYPPHAQRGDSVSSAAHHERRRLDAATAGSLDASAPSGRLPSTVEEPPMPQDGGRGGLSAYSPFSQQQQPKQEEEPMMPQDGGRGGLSAFSPFSQQQQQPQPKQEEEPLPQDGGRGGLSAFSPFSQQQQEDMQPFGPPSRGNNQQQQQPQGGGGLRGVE